MKNWKRARSALLLALSAMCALAADRPARFAKPEDVVAWLYRDFGWECFIAHSFDEDILIDQPRPILERYFDPKLAERIARDRAFVERTREVGRIDFVLLFGSQDPDGVGNLRISRSPGSNGVKVVYDQNGEQDIMEMRFDVVKTAKGLRIADIHYQPRESDAGPETRFSLLELLGQPYD
jgi:hypothetical protein